MSKYIKINVIIIAILLVNLIHTNDMLKNVLLCLPVWFTIGIVLSLILMYALVLIDHDESVAILALNDEELKKIIKQSVENNIKNRTYYTITRCLIIILLTLNGQLLSLILFAILLFMILFVDGLTYKIEKSL